MVPIYVEFMPLRGIGVSCLRHSSLCARLLCGSICCALDSDFLFGLNQSLL
ncbi:MAG: hypothetical protein M2R45_02932 [Verrucomicrobia subdivision 3 bacterium]|nr:hypothetical protein [Limisphaerales bacterium]MCS1415347.1 hypothetical protein [Limisphaerales bacterium]